jgi:hypothetical protein
MREEWKICRSCGRYYFANFIVECTLCLDFGQIPPMLTAEKNFKIVMLTIEEVVEALCVGAELGGTIRPDRFDPYLERLEEAKKIKEPVSS